MRAGCGTKAHAEATRHASTRNSAPDNKVWQSVSTSGGAELIVSGAACRASVRAGGVRVGSAPRRSSGSERTRHSSDVYRVSKKSVVMGFLGVQCGISKLAGSQVGETADIVLGRRQHSTVQRAYPCPSIPGTGRSPSFPRRGSRSRKVLPTSSCRCVEVRGGAWRCQGNMELQGDLPTVAILTRASRLRELERSGDKQGPHQPEAEGTHAEREERRLAAAAECESPRN